MTGLVDWPENVPANIQHGQIWKVAWSTEHRRPFYSIEHHEAFVVVVHVPEDWPKEWTIPFLRSRTAYGSVRDLSADGIVENINWLLNNFMKLGDWVKDLTHQSGRKLRWIRPYRLALDEHDRPYLLEV